MPQRFQQKLADLAHTLQTATGLTQRIDTLTAYARELVRTNGQKALDLAQEANQLAIGGADPQQPYTRGLAESLLILSDCHHLKANYETALTQALQAVALCEQGGLPDLFIRGLIQIGINYVRLGDPAEGLTYHLRALKLAEEQNNLHEQAIALNCIAIVHVYRGDHRRVWTILARAFTSTVSRATKSVRLWR
jgi:tetratricopeptide (TPR) repeat protein